MLSSRFVRYIPPEERTRTRAGRLFERWGRAYEALDRKYERGAGMGASPSVEDARRRGRVFLVSLGSAAFMGTEFVPAEDRGEFQVIVDLPAGDVV
jgi:multidrug efflux pump subunit AcrB